MTSTRKAVIPSPKTIVAAIGIKNWAWSDFSNKSADNPPIVVSDVNRTGQIYLLLQRLLLHRLLYYSYSLYHFDHLNRQTFFQ